MKLILCFSRSYLANLFSELEKYDNSHKYLHIVQSVEEQRLIEKKGGKVILCLDKVVRFHLKEKFNKNVKFNEPIDFREVTNYFWSPLLADRYLVNYDLNEREIIANAIFNSIEQVFKKYRIDILLSEPVAIFSTHVLLYFSKKNNIKPRLWSPTYFPGYFYFSEDIVNSTAVCRKIETTGDIEKLIREYSYNVTIDKSGPKYHHSFANKEKSFWAYFKQRKGLAPTVIEPDFRTILIQLLRLIYSISLKFLYPLLGDFQSAVSWKEHLFYLKCLFFRKSYYDLLPNEYNENNVFFPLHFEPEASLTYLSPSNSDQFIIIESIIKSLPKNKILFVKEHPNQFGALGMQKWAELRKKYPNIRYIYGRESGRFMIKSSSLVISISSSAGMDALLLGKNVIVLGDVFYKKFSGVIFCDSFSEISRILNNDSIYVKNNQLSGQSINDLCNFGLMSYKGDPQPSKDLLSQININDLLSAFKIEFE